jgi:hypothetical protein
MSISSNTSNPSIAAAGTATPGPTTQTTARETGADAGGSLLAPRDSPALELAIGDGGSFSLLPTPRAQQFIDGAKASLRTAEQQGKRFSLPPPTPQTVGWSSPALHNLMTADGATVLVPLGEASPGDTLSQMRSDVRSAMESYLVTHHKAFEGLTESTGGLIRSTPESVKQEIRNYQQALQNGGSHGIVPDKDEDRRMIDHAVKQFDRLIDRLDGLR